MKKRYAEIAKISVAASYCMDEIFGPASTKT